MPTPARHGFDGGVGSMSLQLGLQQLAAHDARRTRAGMSPSSDRSFTERCATTRRVRHPFSIGSYRCSIATCHPESAMMQRNVDADWELRFDSLFDDGRGWAFPCDAEGCVDLDRLSDRARINYLFARAMIGRDVAFPVVRPRTLH